MPGGVLLMTQLVNYSPNTIVNDGGSQSNIERVQYYDKDGKTNYRKVFAIIPNETFWTALLRSRSFLYKWNATERKEAIVEELKNHGVLLEALRELSGNKDLDDFDLICHFSTTKAAH